MKNRILLLLTSLLLLAIPKADAAIYSWNQVLASDCTALTSATSCNGIACTKQALCWNITNKVMYTCDPASGSTCTTSADWKAGGGGWVDNGTYLTPLTSSRPVAIGTGVPQSNTILDIFGNVHIGSNLFRCDATNGCRFDADNNNSTDITFSPAGVISTGGGFVYTGSNIFMNVSRATDKPSPALGDAWYNTVYPGWIYWNGSFLKRIPTEQIYANTFTPAASSNKLLWKTKTNTRIDSIDCIVDPGGVSSVVINIQACNANGGSCSNVDTSSITCGNTSSADDGALSSPTVSSGGWINLNQVSTAGSPSNLTITVKYSQLP